MAQVDSQVPELLTISDLVAGCIALRHHIQLVRRLLCEDRLVLDGDSILARSFYGDPIEVLQHVRPQDGASQAVSALLAALNAGPAKLRKTGAGILHWMNRAREESSLEGRFIALFIPLEMVLEGVSAAHHLSSHIARLRELVAKAGNEKESLGASLDLIAKGLRPSLNDRFREFARLSGYSLWERDVEAFGKFNKMRNAMLHRGEQGASTVQLVDDHVVADLEDLAERYVSQSLFGNMNVYESRYRRASRPVI